jgi:hypothetical protein
MTTTSRTPSPARTLLATVGFLLIVAFFLATEHRAHLFGLLPFVLLLACPLLHMFGHGGHGGHGGHAQRDRTDRSAARERDVHAGHRARPEGRS